MAPFRYKPIKLLEIGLLRGASILSWRCFFPFGTTIGVDLEPKPGFSGNKTRIYQADQGSADDLAIVCQREAPFDIIIDDGSHFNKHQIFSFNYLFPHLRDGGLYIIEDVQTSFWDGEELGIKWDGASFNAPEFADTCYGKFLELAKYLNHAEFPSLERVDTEFLKFGRNITRIAFEHNVIAIFKGPNTVVSNVIHHSHAPSPHHSHTRPDLSTVEAYSTEL